MPTSLENITKGGILAKFDAYINGPNNSHKPAVRIERAIDLLKRLKSTAGLGDIIIESGIPLTPDEETHLRRDWLNETGRGWWGDIDVEFRGGFTESAEAVKSTGDPVDHYWISGVNTEKPQMLARPGPAQVTTLIATPTPPSV